MSWWEPGVVVAERHACLTEPRISFFFSGVVMRACLHRYEQMRRGRNRGFGDMGKGM